MFFLPFRNSIGILKTDFERIFDAIFSQEIFKIFKTSDYPDLITNVVEWCVGPILFPLEHSNQWNHCTASVEKINSNIVYSSIKIESTQKELGR